LRKLIVALTLLLLSAVGGIASFRNFSQLRSEAGWLLVRADAQATDYATSLQSRLAEGELSTFDQRRALLERAHRWQQLEIACVLLAAASAFAAYGFYVFRRARYEPLRGEAARR
jgi:hypothetical protein